MTGNLVRTMKAFEAWGFFYHRERSHFMSMECLCTQGVSGDDAHWEVGGVPWVVAFLDGTWFTMALE